MGDAALLETLLTHLLDNALKFVPADRTPVIEIDAQLSKGTAVIRIADNGIGIDPAQGALLFTPFTQADVSTTRKYGGTGLGLAISRQIALRMHGDIGFTSEPGVGSTFSVTARFPVRARPSSLPADPGLRGRSAVVAAPSAATREALLVALGELGVSATLALRDELAPLVDGAARVSRAWTALDDVVGDVDGHSALGALWRLLVRVQCRIDALTDARLGRAPSHGNAGRDLALMLFLLARQAERGSSLALPMRNRQHARTHDLCDERRRVKRQPQQQRDKLRKDPHAAVKIKPAQYRRAP
jgi:hypothetical protein